LVVVHGVCVVAVDQHVGENIHARAGDGRFLTAKRRHLGYVPRDENVHRAVMAQRPVVDLFPMAPASRAIVDVAARLFSEPAPQILEGGMKMMWQRLMKEAEVPR